MRNRFLGGISERPTVEEICRRFASNLSRHFGAIEYDGGPDPRSRYPRLLQQAHVDFIMSGEEMDKGLKWLNRLLIDPAAVNLSSFLKRNDAVKTFNLPVPKHGAAQAQQSGMSVRCMTERTKDEDQFLVRFDVLYQTATVQNEEAA